MESSAHLDLVPGALSADIVLHDAPIGEGSFPCWTVLTNGLLRHKQQEVALTIVRDSDDINDFPETVLGYLPALLEFAKQGRIVGEGGLSFYQAPGPFNLGSFTGIAYTAAGLVPDSIVPSGTLSGLFLTAEEANMAHRCSVFRVLSRLGQAYRYFPWPYWSDPRRSSLYAPEDADQSILSKVNKLHAATASATISGNEMRLVMPRSVATGTAERLAAGQAIAVLTGRDPSVPAALVWGPGQSEATAITYDRMDGSRLAAWFALVVPSNERTDAIRFQEDGYCVLLTAETAAKLTEALRFSSTFRMEPRGSELSLTILISEGGASS